MKKKTLKFFIIILVLGLALISCTQVQAALQANQNTQYTKKDTPTNWMSNIRKMEETGGSMGLTESLNSDLTSVESNNIDVHMMRSTEYGAIAILSASGYGNPSNSQEITTTTGNNTGVFINTTNNDTYCQWVAGGLDGYVFSGTNSRYYDTYTESNESARKGDALGTSGTTNPGCAGWHSAAYAAWLGGNNYYYHRGIGGVFSFHRNEARFTYCSRGVAVCGAGL